LTEPARVCKGNITEPARCSEDVQLCLSQSNLLKIRRPDVGSPCLLLKSVNFCWFATLVMNRSGDRFLNGTGLVPGRFRKAERRGSTPESLSGVAKSQSPIKAQVFTSQQPFIRTVSKAATPSNNLAWRVGVHRGLSTPPTSTPTPFGCGSVPGRSRERRGTGTNPSTYSLY